MAKWLILRIDTSVMSDGAALFLICISVTSQGFGYRTSTVSGLQAADVACLLGLYSFLKHGSC
jgi:hypothetical protein